MHNFKQWCLSNYATSEASQATHLFMDKGKIHVPVTKFPEFLQKYYDALHNENICLIEKLGTNCLMRFFLDVDTKESHIHLSDIIHTITNCANEILSSIGDVYVCSQNKGIHIVYNKLVTCNEALQIADDIVENLESEYKYFIDKSVYKTGLRMVGSCKYVSGVLIQRSYMPFAHHLTFDILKRSIVRIKKLDSTQNGTTTVRNMESDCVDNFLKCEFQDAIKINSMKKLGNYISCTTNNKYCGNIQGYHKNSKIYFVFDVKKRICYQKCFCPCLKPNVFNSCKNYRSKSVNVPYLVINSLLDAC